MYTKQYIINIDALHLTGKHLHLHNLVVKFQNFPQQENPSMKTCQQKLHCRFGCATIYNNNSPAIRAVPLYLNPGSQAGSVESMCTGQAYKLFPIHETLQAYTTIS